MKYMRNQTKWISRTVMVQDNGIEDAMKVLNGIMANEGMMQRWKLTRRWVIIHYDTKWNFGNFF